MEKRYFTIEEANEMIPFLEDAFGRIIQMRMQIESLHQRLEDLDASNFDQEEFSEEPEVATPYIAHTRAMLKGLMAAVRDELDDVRSSGCLIKSVDTGLVDWYARHEGRDIFLCWQLGENGITHWHEIDGGFRGRRPIEELGDTRPEQKSA